MPKINRIENRCKQPEISSKSKCFIGYAPGHRYWTDNWNWM